MEEATPIIATFNKHFKNFTVVTKYDIRVYGSIDGKLTKVFTDLLPSNKQYNPEITKTFMGGRDRKIYVGDNAGNLRLYNVKNCEFLKHVNILETETNTVVKLSQLTFSDMGCKNHHDVTSILYITDEKLLIVGTKDSVIKIYDESDFEDAN